MFSRLLLSYREASGQGKGRMRARPGVKCEITSGSGEEGSSGEPGREVQSGRRLPGGSRGG